MKVWGMSFRVGLEPPVVSVSYIYLLRITHRVIAWRRGGRKKNQRTIRHQRRCSILDDERPVLS